MIGYATPGMCSGALGPVVVVLCVCACVFRRLVDVLCADTPTAFEILFLSSTANSDTVRFPTSRVVATAIRGVNATVTVSCCVSYPYVSYCFVSYGSYHSRTRNPQLEVWCGLHVRVVRRPCACVGDAERFADDVGG